MIQGLRTAIYFVKDIEKAKEWYSGILGKQPYFDSPFYVGFNIGGFELGLHPASDDTKTGTSVIAYWGVPDAHKAFETLINKGAEPHDRIDDVGEGILIGSVKDPFGNIFGIIQNPNFKVDE
jgi:catechol 2,3-dioxygenase-like lactoylglutathione lyase family enzyme